MGNCAAMRDLDSNSGPETPVPVLLLSRGCLSTPSSRLGTGASKLGLSAIPFGNQYIASLFRIECSAISATVVSSLFPAREDATGMSRRRALMKP